MGCGASTNRPSKSLSSKVETHETEQSPSPVVFKVLPSETQARQKFENDGTLTKNSDSGHLALRTLLDEPLSQNLLGKFASKIQVLDVFMCWVDIQEYKNIPAGSYRRSKALHIYNKYIKEDATLVVGVLSPQDRNKIANDLQLSKDDPNLLTKSFYDQIQTKCFLDMYSNIYLPFKQTPEFQQLNQQLKNKYNSVRVSDFDYYNKLGEGGFGFVVHCRKKSTGKHYAMKIQTKVGMLDCYRDDPWKANLEKEAFASLQHPFIVNLFYAFQTPTLTFMLVDLGGVMDESGRWAAKKSSSEALLPLFASPNTVLDVVQKEGSSGDSSEKEKDHKHKPKRKQSIMGTVGYMAPEMVILLNKPQKYGEPEKIHTKQLTRNRPFADKNVQAFVQLATGMREVVEENVQFKEYAQLFQQLTYPVYVSIEAQDIMNKLMDVNDETRLGSKGVQEVKNHPYFQGLDFILLEQKQLEPPF
eukprot:gene34683-41999_t